MVTWMWWPEEGRGVDEDVGLRGEEEVGEVPSGEPGRMGVKKAGGAPMEGERLRVGCWEGFCWASIICLRGDMEAGEVEKEEE